MNKKDNLFILTGPTGIGKTSISINLASKMNGEIISADSMQIYKFMNIGSAKIAKEEMKDIPHHLIDILYPDEEYTVAGFKEDAKELIKDVNQRNKLPMIVGGTGLYINSLIYDLNFTKVEPQFSFRDDLESLAQEHGNEYLHKRLKIVDEISAKRININDRKRIIRALEIYEVTGKPMSKYYKDFRKPNEDYNLVMIGLNMDRDTLYGRINQRVDYMIKDGLIEEVKTLLNMGYSKELISMQGIGYKEIIMYIDGQYTLEKSIEEIKKGSRNYAKRQLTWFRRDDRIKWYNVDKYQNREDIINDIIKLALNEGLLREEEVML